MLNPRYLDGLSDELNEIYNQLEIDILRDMAKRTQRIFSRVDTKNPNAINPLINANEWQAMIIAETGGLHQKIRQILRFYSPEIRNEIERLCIEAMKKNIESNNAVFKEATGRTVSENNAQAMLNLVQKCHSDLSNFYYKR